MSGITEKKFRPFAFLFSLSDSEYGTIDDDYTEHTENKAESEGLIAGDKVADKMAELTVEDTSKTFGPDIEGKEVSEDIKKNNGKKSKEDLPNKLKEQGITGIEPKEVTESAEKRKSGGKTRDSRDRK